MKWFKHSGNARGDNLIDKLLLKYGVNGYGLYFYCLEIIAGNLSTESITFELKHDAETIAGRLHMDTLQVEEIMRWMVDQGLFQLHPTTGRVMCLGLLKRLDTTMNRSPAIQHLLASPEAQRMRVSMRVAADCVPDKTIPDKKEEKSLPRSPMRPGTEEMRPGVYLTPDEYQRLCMVWEPDSVDATLDSLSNALDNTIKADKYRDHYKTMQNWLKKAEEWGGARRRPETKYCANPDCGQPYEGTVCTACGVEE